MINEEINRMAGENRQKAIEVLSQSAIVETLTSQGLRVNIIGSLKMDLLAAHRDIDLHVYSSGITVESSFAVMAKIAADPHITQIKCINGLQTDEHCIAWHLTYRSDHGETWQIDIIHIESGTEYDGYFEHMAQRILHVMTPEQRDTILRLKFTTPPGRDYHGVEYYEAVIAHNISSFHEFETWVATRRKKTPYYWIP